MSFRLRTLGTLSLEGPPGATLPTTVLQRRRLALLALMAGSGGMSRDQVLGQLWADMDEDSARHALSQSLYVIRRALGPDAVVAEGTRLRLDPGLVASDVAGFELALEEGRLGDAVDAYGGPFLDGFHAGGAPAFDAWVEERRRQLAERYGRALARLAEESLAAGRPGDAVRWLRKRAAADPYAPDVARSLMRTLVAAGDVVGALRHFETHASLLRQELGLEPEPELAALAAELREGRRTRRQRRGAHAARVMVPAPAPEAGTPPPLGTWKRVAGGLGTRLVVALAAVTMLAVLAGRFARPAAGTAPVPVEVVLADVSGSDSALVLALRESLRAELDAVESIRRVQPDLVRRTLVMMMEPPGAALTAERALQVAQRTGAQFVVDASAMPLGEGAQIVVRLLTGQTGDLVLSVAERPRTGDDILPAIARAGMRVRDRIRSTGDAAAPMLPAVSTASLQALKLYAQAREAAALGRLEEAIRMAEAALVHDSLFALAHYEVAEQLWFLDRQSRSDAHIRAAHRLAERLPQRERLIVGARYDQLVRDEPDSALARWQVLAASHPDEPLAYAGMRWAHRALGQTPEMLAASRDLVARDSSRVLAYVLDRIQERLEADDTATALELARRYEPQREGLHAHTAFLAALRASRFADGQAVQGLNAADRVLALLLVDRLDEAVRELPAALEMEVQFPPRVLTWAAHAAADLEPRGPRGRAWVEALIRWIGDADLSPPAYARLVEKAALPAALLGDTAAVRRLRELLHELDAGRGLRSYVLAGQAVDAALALARGEASAAARLAADADPAMYYGRAPGVLLFIEAEARARLGEHAAARALAGRLLRQEGWAGDPEGAAWLARSAARRLEKGW